jgi:hypothetical protein
MQRVGRQGLIHYTWGERGPGGAKRIVVLLVLTFHASGLFVALATRRSGLVQLQPDRVTLYRVDASGVVDNRFRLKVANRSRASDTIRFWVEGLQPSAAMPCGRQLAATRISALRQ